MTSAVYSKAVQQRVNELLAVSDKWAGGYDLKTGVRFHVFASQSSPNVFYRTRIDGKPGTCTCPAARLSRVGDCSHLIACRALTEQAQEEAATPKRSVTAEALWGMTCNVVGCTDDQQDGESYCKRHQLGEF